MRRNRRHPRIGCALAASVAGVCSNSAYAAAPMAATPAVKAALDEALADERKAFASYQAIIGRFGDVKPFSNIVHAEQRHIEALLPLYTRYGLTPPENDAVAPDEVYREDLLGLCKIGVQAEIDNVRLYDEKLLPAVADFPDISAVMRNLRDASNNRHLPAFQRCVVRGVIMGRGGRH